MQSRDQKHEKKKTLNGVVTKTFPCKHSHLTGTMSPSLYSLTQNAPG
jgi:hypothetical protein